MSLLKSGPHLVLIYPEVETEDSYGDPMRRPSEKPFELRTRVQNLSSTEAADLSLDPATTKYFKTARTLPAGAWARVEYGGRDYDVVGEPQRIETAGRAGKASHTHVVLKARAPQAAPAATGGGNDG